MNQSERIRAAMRLKGLTNAELGRLCGVSSAAVGQWLNQSTKAPKAENIFRIARATGVSPEWLTSGKGEMTSPSKNSNIQELPANYRIDSEVPILSWVQAGAWSDSAESIDLDKIEMAPRPPNCSAETFALWVVGESMSDEYPPGVLIFVDPTVEPKSGSDVVVQFEDHGNAEATFKRYLVEPGHGPVLKALNADWRPRYLELTKNCRIVGVVKAQMRMM